MNDVRIVTGWSNPGGSTVAFINLCNLFNDNGIDCTFYGPQDWHLDKCQSRSLNKENPFIDNDKVNFIFHFLNTDLIPENLKKSIFSCHETNLYPLKEASLDKVDLIHYVSNFQRAWHSVNHPYKIIPNVLDDLKQEPKDSNEVAGVIGSIDRHKQPHLSVLRAAEEGFSKIHLYGELTDERYFNTTLMPLIAKNKNIEIELMGHEDDKQAMYNSLAKVYHSSSRETFNYIKAECELTGTEYDSLESADANAEYWDKERILKTWMELLNEDNHCSK